MTRDTKFTLAALSVIAAAGIGVALVDKPEAKDTLRPSESHVVWIDGLKRYAVPVDQADGGQGVTLTEDAPCKRRQLRTRESCVRTFTAFVMTEKGYELRETVRELRDGDTNRYPASELEGDGCEGVACAVMLGDDADDEERPR